MATIQAGDIADLVTTTLNDLGELKFTDISHDYQNTHALKRFFKKGKMTFNAGPNVDFNLITDDNGSARATSMYDTVTVNPTNVMTTGSVPWRHQTFNWGADLREIAMNRSPRKIVDLIKTRRFAGFSSWVQFMEQRMWRVPSSTDTLNIYGIPYWIVKSNTATTTNNGFNGSVPSGYTQVGGITPTSATVTPRWNNYATQYTNVTRADLIDKMYRMADMCRFEPLVDDAPDYDTGYDVGWCTTYSVRNSMKSVLEGNNDNLGFDLDPVNNKVAFRRAPVVWCKELDEDTTGPVYLIQWGVFHAMGLRDWWMKETRIPFHENQPTVTATHVHCTCNLYTTDRRQLGVLATDTTLPS